MFSSGNIMHLIIIVNIFECIRTQITDAKHWYRNDGWHKGYPCKYAVPVRMSDFFVSGTYKQPVEMLKHTTVLKCKYEIRNHLKRGVLTHFFESGQGHGKGWKPDEITYYIAYKRRRVRSTIF